MGHWFEWVRLIGAAYLIWMGVQMFRSKGTLNPDGSARKPRGGFFLQGFLVAISNPKTLVFFGAFFPQFIAPQGNYTLQIVVMSTMASSESTSTGFSSSISCLMRSRTASEECASPPPAEAIEAVKK